MKRLISLFLASTLLLSACGTEKEEEKNYGAPLKTVDVEKAMVRYFSPSIEVSGTLKPKYESAVAAETSGTIGQIFASEGDQVDAAETLLTFATHDNFARIDLENARNAFKNAERTLELTKKQTEESEKIIELAISQAQTNLENAKKSDSSTGNSNEAQIASAESNIELTKLNVENAEKMLQELRENLDQQEKNLEENRKNTTSNAMITFRSSLQYADSILGVTPETRENNDAFQTMLGFQEPQTKITAENTLRRVWHEFISLEEQYAEEKIPVEFSALEDTAYEIRDVLQKVDIMLQKSRTGGGLTEKQLSEFQSGTTKQRSTNEDIIQGISTLSQQIEDFEIRLPQQIRTAELALQQAKQQQIQAEKSLLQVKSGGDLSKVSAENQISNAQNTLETQKIQLALQKKQSEVAIQQSISARDSAKDAVRRAELQFSKLAVRAPIPGVIIEKMVEVGQSISSGSPLFVIAQTEILILEAEIPIEYLSVIQERDTAFFDLDVFGEMEGYVSNIYPAADEATRRIKIEVAVENFDQKIPANIFASARIFLPEKKESFMIPFKSLISQDPAKIFVIKTAEERIPKDLPQIFPEKTHFFETFKNISFILDSKFPSSFITLYEVQDKIENTVESLHELKYTTSDTKKERFVELQKNYEKKLYGFLEERELELGEEDNGRIEVFSGLSEGDMYVPKPLLGLQKGDIVVVKLEDRILNGESREEENNKDREEESKISKIKELLKEKIEQRRKEKAEAREDSENNEKEDEDSPNSKLETPEEEIRGDDPRSELKTGSSRAEVETKDLSSEEKESEEGLVEDEEESSETLTKLLSILEDYEIKTFDKTFAYLEEESGIKMPRYQFRKNLYPFNTVDPTTASQSQIQEIIEIYLKDRFGEDE